MISRLPQVTKKTRKVIFYKRGYHMLLRDLQSRVVWQDIDAWIKESIKWGNGFVIFAKQQKKIVGIALLEFLHFDPQNQFDQPKMLHFIWVDPKMRRKGVGKLLLQQESEVYGTPCSDSADKFFTGIGWHISPNGPSLDGCYLWQTPQEQNKSNLEITT